MGVDAPTFGADDSPQSLPVPGGENSRDCLTPHRRFPKSEAMNADFNAILDDFEVLDDRDERYRLLIDLGRALEPMPDALKTEATKVRGCSASVWVYPTRPTDAGCISLPTATPHHQGHRRADPRAGAGQDGGRRAGARHRGASRAVRARQAAVVEPHAGRAEHDRAGPRDRRAARGMKALKPIVDGFLNFVPHVKALGIEYRAHRRRLGGTRAALTPSISLPIPATAARRASSPRAQSSR